MCAIRLGALARLVTIALSRPELQALMMGVDVDRLIPPRPAWMADAACREHPEVDFFPGRGRSARPALAVCRDCVVREHCLTYAQENGECGIWGGQVLKWSERRGRRRLKADMKARAAEASSQ